MTRRTDVVFETGDLNRTQSQVPSRSVLLKVRSQLDGGALVFLREIEGGREGKLDGRRDDARRRN